MFKHLWIWVLSFVVPNLQKHVASQSKHMMNVSFMSLLLLNFFLISCSFSEKINENHWVWVRSKYTANYAEHCFSTIKHCRNDACSKRQSIIMKQMTRQHFFCFALNVVSEISQCLTTCISSFQFFFCCH